MLSQSYFILTALLLLGSLATCGFLGRKLIRGEPWPAHRQFQLAAWPDWLLPAAITCWVVISLAGMKAMPGPAAGIDAIRNALTHNTLVHATLFVVLAGLVELARWRVPKQDPLSSPKPPPDPVSRQLLYGLVGFLACLAPTLVVFTLTEPFRTDAELHPLLKLIGQDQTRGVLLAVTVSAVMVAPWVEEMAFRVIMQRAFLRHFSPSKSILLTAVLFCAIHPSWQDAVGLFPLAVVLGVTYHRTGSFLAVVLTHMLFNAHNILSMLMESVPA